jgi:hypothetical protein
VLAKVATEGTVKVAPVATTYKKDDFFDWCVRACV